jgi:uncharacterized surface anchored protein
VTTIIVYIQQPAQATIHVTNTSGAALSGASVTLRRADGATLPAVVTNTNGDAVFSQLLYADYSATIAKAGYPSATMPFSMLAGAAASRVNVAIAPLLGVGLQVRVYDTNGTPLSGATVTVRRDGNTTPLQTGTVGTNGQIAFSGLDAGDYNATVDRTGYVSQVKSDSMYDGDHDTLDFYLTPVVVQGSMRVTALDKYGHAASIRVIISGPNGYYRNDLWSNSSGVLSVTGLVPGSYQVKCYTKPSSTATVIVNGGQTAEVQISQTW